MKEKIVEFNVSATANRVNQLILEEIKKSIFKKRFNLTGDTSTNSGINIYRSFSFVTFEPSLGPLIKLNIICTNSNTEGTVSIMKLKRINGVTYYMQYWFSLLFTGISLLISLYQIVANGLDKIDMILLPLFGIFYFYIIQLISHLSTDSLVSKIESLLKIENIKYEKI